MTNETNAPTSTVVPPVATNGEAPATEAPKSAAERLAALMALLGDEKGDELDTILTRFEKAATKEVERKEREAAEAAFAGKKAEFATFMQASVKDGIDNLGIVIPEKGLTLSYDFKLTHDSTGGLMISVEEKTKALRSASTGGTRAPRSTSGTSDNRPALTNLGIASFKYGDAEIKAASQLAEALGIKNEKDSAPRYVAAWARTNPEKANEVIAVLADGTEAFLGDLVLSAYPVKETETASA